MAAIVPDNLTTIDHVTAILGIPDQSENTLLTMLIQQVSAAVLERLGRRVLLLGNAAQPLTEYYSGKGGEWLLLRQRPLYVPTLTGDTTAGSAVVTNLAGGIGPDPTSFLFVGQPVTGVSLPLIPVGASSLLNVNIASIDSPTQITLNTTAAATATDTPLTFGLRVWVNDAGYYGTPTNAFPSAAELSWGGDFSVNVDEPDGTSRSGMVLRMNDVWDTQYYRGPGMLSQLQATGLGNIKVQYLGGYASVPADIEAFVIRVIARMRDSRLYGSALRSENDGEGYSKALANGEARARVALGLLQEDGSLMARYNNAGFGE